MEIPYEILMPLACDLVESKQEWIKWQAEADKDNQLYSTMRWCEEAGKYEGLLLALSAVTEIHRYDFDARVQRVMQADTDPDNVSKYADLILNACGYV